MKLAGPLLFACLAACSSPKAPLPAATEDAASPATDPVAHDTPDAEVPAAPATATPTASSTPAPPSGPSDDCTPAGVAFEKTVRPKMKECYHDAKKKNPNLEGTVKITLAIDLKGKIKSIKITEKTLPDPVAQCMLKVVKSTPFPDAAKCPDKNITVPITFPTPP